jgi:hypothetical protein
VCGDQVFEPVGVQLVKHPLADHVDGYAHQRAD